MSPEPEEAEVAAWLAQGADRIIETAIARVFLKGGLAFKQKRRIRLSYVDFSTAELRLAALRRELAFNAAAAPRIYRAVQAVTRTPAGGLEIDGPGETVDHVLKMRRFEDGAVLSVRPQTVDGALGERLGRRIAELHACAPLRPDGGLPGLRLTAPSNAQLLREARGLDADAVEALVAATDAALARHAPLIGDRARAGYARRCHGDLHLGNLLLEEGEVVAFDCIEFNDLLSDIDVLYDLAFLLMDLQFRDRRSAAVRALSGYVDQAARHFGQDFWAGFAALPLLLSIRAGVRAHVSAHSGQIEAARAYVGAALEHLAPRRPVLAAVGGLSGSGKSTVARLIAPALGAAPGAVILRSDEIRKHLLGAGPLEALPPSAYAPQADARVYAEMLARAQSLLAAGRGVVLDATFLAADQRRAAERMAEAAGVSFHGAWLDAPPHLRASRVAGRRGDASDATVAVLAAQTEPGLRDLDWPRLDASGPAEAAARAWLSRLP